MQMAAFLCYTITKTDEFVSSRYIGAGARVQRCGSPVATSKGRRYFEAPTEPTGETSSLKGVKGERLAQ